ncbi:MAG: hypothetical protein ABWY93_12465 [Mycobacterium sp.]
MTSQEPTDVPNADEILSTPATPGAQALPTTEPDAEQESETSKE